MFTFLEPYMLYIKLAFIVAVFLAGCYVTRLYYTHQLQEAIIATQKAEAALAAKGNDIQIKYVKEIQTVVLKGKDREIKVVEYVPVESVPVNCPNPNVLNNGFVELHNAAVENRELAKLSEEVIIKDSDKTKQHLAMVINTNYTTCNKYIKQIEGLQTFIEEVEKATK